jgi:hypothetical protein
LATGNLNHTTYFAESGASTMDEAYTDWHPAFKKIKSFVAKELEANYPLPNAIALMVWVGPISTLGHH